MSQISDILQYFKLFGTRLRTGYLLAFLLLVSSFLLVFYANRKIAKRNEFVNQWQRHNKLAEDLNREFLRAHASTQYYFTNGQTRQLQTYLAARNKWPSTITRLRSPGPASSVETDAIGKLIWLMLTYRFHTDRAIQIFQRKESDWQRQWQLANNEAAKVQKDLDSTFELLANWRRTSIESSLAKLGNAASAAQVIAIIALFMVAVIIFYTWATYVRESSGRQKAVAAAGERTEELALKQTELDQANVEMKALKNIEKFAATGRIARTIAHEVRNPITNISMAVEQLREFETTRPEYTMLLQLITRNTDRINGLATNLLQATRFDDLMIRPYPLAELIEEVLFLARDRIDLQQVQVHKYMLDQDCVVAVDVPKIKIAILNVVVNALEAVSDRRGVIEIWSFCEGGYGRVEVRDNGPGMEEETLQNLFEPFYTRKDAGNGLGLTNSQNILINHRGVISAESIYGKGSRFVISIPCAHSTC
jgi:signal transduction histidine kinase